MIYMGCRPALPPRFTPHDTWAGRRWRDTVTGGWRTHDREKFSSQSVQRNSHAASDTVGCGLDFHAQDVHPATAHLRRPVQSGRPEQHARTAASLCTDALRGIDGKEGTDSGPSTRELSAEQRTLDAYRCGSFGWNLTGPHTGDFFYGMSALTNARSTWS